MKTFTERDYITYPRNFKAYRWYKPLLVGFFFIIFLFIFNMSVEYITRTLFGTIIHESGYDEMDFFTAAGAFRNSALNACYIPSIILAALIVKDRPVSSYFSSMGGWRWKVFFKTLAIGLLIVAIPNMIYHALPGHTGEIRFTIGGFIMLTLFLPLQSMAEELLYRGYIMQTTGSWFKIAFIGLIAQILPFMTAHSYNITGLISVALSALIYGLICVYTRGIESSSALHILNNLSGVYMAGFGFGSLTSEQSVSGVLFNETLKLLFLLFILYADRKLHWFDELRYDDITSFNEKTKKKDR
ncbi:MAG: CPBP family intramembrane metalloprotease [Erysipelotrichaceae bacterium]|nr:CPBP family intramembrane metalloprotease [Erysipelotrichaceae bacterium]